MRCRVVLRDCAGTLERHKIAMPGEAGDREVVRWQPGSDFARRCLRRRLLPPAAVVAAADRAAKSRRAASRIPAASRGRRGLHRDAEQRAQHREQRCCPGGRAELPLSGTATYSGFGSIFDSSLTTADTTAARLRGRSVVTDVSATANFGTRTVTITQDRFRDVDGTPLPDRPTGRPTMTRRACSTPP